MVKTAVPVYMQIHDEIKIKIEEGHWQVGDRLPSERELSQMYEVSRMTLRQAIQTLADEGLLERKMGSGTYVAAKKVQEKMSGTTSFTELMRSQGKVPSNKTVSYQEKEASTFEKEELQLATGNIIKMERVRYADGVPICLEITSIPAFLVKDVPQKEVTHSYYQVLENKGYQVKHAKQVITAVLANESQGRHLGIRKGDPLLQLSQISYLADGTPCEYVQSLYVGNRFEFYLEK